jgi:hypothetical protein
VASDPVGRAVNIPEKVTNPRFAGAHEDSSAPTTSNKPTPHHQSLQERPEDASKATYMRAVEII